MGAVNTVSLWNVLICALCAIIICIAIIVILKYKKKSIICKKCGYVIKDNNTFCENCGAKVR